MASLPICVCLPGYRAFAPRVQALDEEINAYTAQVVDLRGLCSASPLSI